MDSSDLRSINSNVSMSNDIADNSSMVIPSKRDIFLSTYRHQNFSLPNSMMHYIVKNPKNSKVYQKMIKRCKYFFIKNPILVIDYLYYDQNGCSVGVNKTWKNIDINKLSSKLWITNNLNVSTENNSNNSIVSSIFPKIYQSDAYVIYLYSQTISYREFMFLCSSVKELIFTRVTVKNDDNTEVLFEKLVEQIPNVKKICYTFTTTSNYNLKNTFKELWKVPHLSNYDCFELYNIPEDFDIDCFSSFMKKNKNTRIGLYFSVQISEELKARLEAIIDEIIATKDHGYKLPFFHFFGLDQEKISELYRRFSL